ncbi:MAG: glycosyltransferase family 9 protein [Burkholderiales bacterium]|nr:glycosyltransferase family 9 protein [Burkholderiales bacterium]
MTTPKRRRLPGRLYTAYRWLTRAPLTWPRKRPATVRTILVMHQLLLGDALMATALLAKLRARYPNAAIHLALPRAFVPLFQHQPWGVTAHAFDVRDLSTLRALAALPAADLCFLPADNRYAWLARGLGARWIVGFAGDKPAHKNWMVDELHEYSAVPTAWSDTVTELAEGSAPAPYAVAQWRAPDAAPFERPTYPYAVLHLGASSALKFWASERWRALAEQLEARGLQPVWSAGAAETELVREVDPTGRWTSLAGQLSLPQLWQLLTGAQVLVCPDTGVAHLGRIVGVPTVTLFGPGSALLCGAGQFWQAMPYRAVTIDIDCRDQRTNFQREISWIRRCERFPGDGPGQCASARCMAGLSFDTVWAATLALLEA